MKDTKNMLNTLARRSFSAGRIRNLIAVLAIALTAVLFTSVTTIGLGTYESLTLSMQLLKGSKSDGDFRNMTAEQFKALSDADFIREYGLRMPVGFLTNTDRHNIELDVMDETEAELLFCNPSHGSMPQSADEIVTSDLALRDLGAEPKVGETVTIEFTAHGKDYSMDMVVSGWYESTNDQTSTMVAGTAFREANPDLFRYTYQNDREIAGTYWSDIIASGTVGLLDNMKNWSRSVGGDPEDMEAPNYLPGIVNEMTNQSIDPSILAMGTVFVILFIFCGYLLIYNVFDIAVNVTPSPIIFIGAALLAALTVFVSTRKPVRKAANIPPIEAFRYVESDTARRSTRRSAPGASLPRLAWSNLGRSRRRTAFIIVSLMLCVVLLNCVGTAAQSVDVDRSDMSIQKVLDFVDIGDTVTVYKNGEPLLELPVLAKAALNGDDEEIGYTAAGTFKIGGDGIYIYLPSDIYEEIYDDPVVYKYAFNVEESQRDNMTAFLTDYMENTDPTIDFLTADSARESAEATQSMISFVGSLVGIIFGVIGVLNLINTVITTILTRRHEFATMRSIGMTQKQLTEMMVFEGLFYALGACILGLVFSLILGFTLVRGLVGGIWYFTFHFTILPALITCVVLVITGLIVPALALKFFNKGSIVEKLRISE